jgi:protein-tyrosine phosphatase
MGVPTIDFMLSIVKVIANEIFNARKVAIHCHAGLGRTGLTIASYMIYALESSADAVSSINFPSIQLQEIVLTS